MVVNKINKTLSMILNKEITQIILPLPTFISDTDIELEGDEKKLKDEKEDHSSSITIQVISNGYIPIIVLFNSFSEMESINVKKILSNSQIKYKYNLIPAIALDATEEQILKLAQLAEVETIGFDDYMKANLETARKWFGVDKAVQTFGVTGNEGNPKTFTKKDNVIAILDTGIDTNHVDLGSGKVIGWHDEINPSITSPYDDNGHGTHVSSIAAGLGKSIWDYRGVAYGAALVGVKVLDNYGYGSYSQIIAGIQWCVNNKSTYGIKVINMSLGGPADYAVRAATDAAVNSGIVVVCAAGNSGPSLNTIGSPGDTPSCITVGNMSDVGQGGFFLVPSSSRGPIFNGSVKPDIVAPGYYITAAKANTTNQYISMSGTSMASPFVAGLVSLMLNANGSLTPYQIKKILIDTANLWSSPNPNNDYGYGRLMSFEALKKVCKMHSSKCDTRCSDTNKEYGPRLVSDKGASDKGLQPSDCMLMPVHFTKYGVINQPYRSDWYEFYVDELGYPVGLTLITKSTVPGTNANLYVYDPNYSLIASNTSSTRQDTITFVPTRYGKYLVRVYRYQGDYVNYQLDLSVFGSKFRWFETN